MAETSVWVLNESTSHGLSPLLLLLLLVLVVVLLRLPFEGNCRRPEKQRPHDGDEQIKLTRTRTASRRNGGGNKAPTSRFPYSNNTPQ